MNSFIPFKNFRVRGSSGKLNLALSELPDLPHGL